MVDHSGAYFYKPPDNRVYGRLDAFAPERRITNHVQQVVGKTSDEKPCLISCEAMAARLVPPQSVFPLLYPVFDLSPPIVDRDYSLCFHVRVGHNKSGTRKEFSHMPFYLADNSSGLIQFLGLVLELDHLHLYSVLWGTAGRPLQVRQNVPLQAIVTGKPNEVSDSLLFAKLVQVWAGKCSIPPEPKLLEPGSVALNQRRDKV